MSTWGRSDPNDETSESELRLEQVSRQPARWRVALVGLSAIVAISVLVLKPWEQARPVVVAALPTIPPQPTRTARPTAHPTANLAPPTATPVPTRDPMEALAAKPRHCVAPRRWRLLSSEQTRTRTVKTLWAASPAEATGPTDPDLPVRLVYADTLLAVGICPPRTPVLSTTVMLHDVILWQVMPDGTITEVTRPRLMDSGLYDLGEAYFSPPVGQGPNWPAGRYVFEIQRLAGAGSRWFGLEFIPTSSSARLRRAAREAVDSPT